MYEFIKKIFSNINNVIFCGVLLILLLWATISSTRLVIATKHLRRTESELGQLRAELSNAQDRESELKGQLENIRGITERTDTLLDQSGTTIQSIREKISVLEEFFNSINQYMCTNDNSYDNSTDSEEQH